MTDATTPTSVKLKAVYDYFANMCNLSAELDNIILSLATEKLCACQPRSGTGPFHKCDCMFRFMEDANDEVDEKLQNVARKVKAMIAPEQQPTNPHDPRPRHHTRR